jgi:hypothetical protein
MKRKFKCKICQCEVFSLRTHVEKEHNITSKQYFDNYIDIKNEHKCIFCSSTCNFKNIYLGYNKLCNECIPKARSCFNIKFWQLRGYSEEEAKIKISEIQRKNNKKYTDKLTIDYWINLGFSENEAKNKVSQFKLENRPEHLTFYKKRIDDESEVISQFNKFKEKNRKIKSDIIANNPHLLNNFDTTLEAHISKYGKEEGIKRYKETCHKKGKSTRIEYWLEQGYSEQESKELLRRRQKTFSKEICIKKYGKEEGLKRWKERQEKWLNTLNSNPKNKNKLKIGRLKGLKNQNKNWSKKSQDLFWSIYKSISNDLLDDDIYFATFNNGQYNNIENHEFVVQLEFSFCLLDFYIKSLNFHEYCIYKSKRKTFKLIRDWIY